MRLRLALALAAPASILLFAHPTPAHAQLADCGDLRSQYRRATTEAQFEAIRRSAVGLGGCDGLNDQAASAARDARAKAATQGPQGPRTQPASVQVPPPPPPPPAPEPESAPVSAESGGEPDVLGFNYRYNLNITNQDRITGECGVYYDEFTRTLGEGDGVEIDATSRTVPLIVAIGTGHLPDNYIIQSINQVDGPEDRTASVRFVAPEAGDYVIVVASADNTIAGPYTVSLRRFTPPPPPEPRRASLGDTVTGTLSASSALLYTEGEVPYDLWTFSGPQGQAVQIDMNATGESGDPYLSFGHVVDGRFQEITSNDDTNGLNSSIVEVLPATGEYVIRARSFGTLTGDQTLPYSLSIQPITITLPDPQPIRFGDTRTSSLTDQSARLRDEGGVPYEPWSFTASAGQRVRIEMRSTEIDPYLILGRIEDGQFVEVARNDDSDGLNSMIRRVLDVDGQYIIRARAFSSSAVGSYELSIQEIPGNPATPLPVSADSNAWVIDGSLAEDSALEEATQTYYQDYRLTAQRNTTYTVRAETGPNGWYTPTVDLRRVNRGATTDVDIYSAETSTRAQNELPPISERGEYIIRVRAPDQGSTGPFRLIITEAEQ